MEFHKIIEFGKDEVSPRFLVDTNTPKPINYMDIKITREFNNFSETRPTFPVKVRAIGSDKFNESLKQNLTMNPRLLNNKYYQMSQGYVIGAYNVSNKKFKMNRVLIYNDSLPQAQFNNNNHILKNPLDNLERDLDSYLDDNAYDFIFFFLIGDSLDFYNGHKYMRNESNVSQMKLFKIDDTFKREPIAFMKKYNSSLNVNKLFRDSTANRVENNKVLSHPLDYFISYFGKICTKKREFVEEIYTYNKMGRNDGNLFFKSILNVGDNRDDLKPILPYENNYPLSNREQYYKDKGCVVMYGFDHYIPFNIYDYTLDNRNPDREVVEIKGVEHTFTCLFTSNDISKDEKFTIRKGIKLSEIKEADH